MIEGTGLTERMSRLEAGEMKVYIHILGTLSIPPGSYVPGIQRNDFVKDIDNLRQSLENTALLAGNSSWEYRLYPESILHLYQVHVGT